MPDRHGARAPEPWWTAFFDDDYADAFLVAVDDAGRERTEASADFLVEHLAVGPGDLVLDQCCGVGRVGIPLAARGIRVVGVELSPPYVDRARRAAAAAGVDATFHCADAFAFTPPEICDAAFNWFTSFSYRADDDGNRHMLDRAFEALRPGGRFALEMVNNARVLSDFHPIDVVRRDGPDGETIVVVENACNLARGMIESTWTFIRADGRRDVRRAETRIVLPHQLAEMLRAVGFEDVRLVTWPDARTLGRMDGRCIALARRPG